MQILQQSCHGQIPFDRLAADEEVLEEEICNFTVHELFIVAHVDSLFAGCFLVTGKYVVWTCEA